MLGESACKHACLRPKRRMRWRKQLRREPPGCQTTASIFPKRRAPLGTGRGTECLKRESGEMWRGHQRYLEASESTGRILSSATRLWRNGPSSRPLMPPIRQLAYRCRSTIRNSLAQPVSRRIGDLWNRRHGNADLKADGFVVRVSLSVEPGHRIVNRPIRGFLLHFSLTDRERVSLPQSGGN